MKIALACQSVLLEKSLEIFLKSYITPYKQCDFVISDKEIEIDKPLFQIANDDSDLVMPFSKSALILKVENNELEQKITKLTDNFRDDLVSVIKEYYDE